MCGRFVVETPRAQLARIFSANIDPSLNSPDRANWNITPTSPIHTVYATEDGSTTITQMRWGLQPSWANKPIINARCETLDSRPFFQKTLRCIVPANGFYEFKRSSPSSKPEPFYFTNPDGSILAFAGVFQVEPGNTGGSAIIITCAANSDMISVHDRMPVLLAQDSWESWLNPLISTSEAQPMLVVPPDGSLKSFPVSMAVNKSSNNYRELIDPI